ncbi:hypothetical protein HanRHA438_Chr03g0138141 [Helianthus annuus]|nr:hypothetical protein HanRHA438_Chr03g0138141 [Helianthus annuus]
MKSITCMSGRTGNRGRVGGKERGPTILKNRVEHEKERKEWKRMNERFEFANEFKHEWNAKNGRNE